MLRKILLLTSFAAIVTAPLFAQVEQVKENQAAISRRIQQEIDMTKDPALGYVPKDQLVEANRLRSAIIKSRHLSGSPLSWTERGPYSDATGPSNGNSRPGNGKTSGRVRAIWQDLSDATGKTVWVGGIDGGLWKTTDITANPATWTNINDFFGNLAIGTICQDPSNPDILYFGTGEKAINADAVRGAGLWFSTDHGINWNVMPNTSAFWNVSKIICDADGNLYVGCNSISNTSGLQRYTKTTGVWTNITPSGLDPRIPDIELSSTGRLHITCGYYNTPATSSGYRYTDNPANVTSTTWTSPATTFPTQYNVDLASAGTTLYALPSNSAFEVATIYKSTNGGVNWVATGATPPALTSGQAWYDMAVGIDPKNANNVIVGGLDCYKSTNGGTSWTKISNWVGTTGQYVHADQHTILWNTLNQVLIGSDGGVHFSGDGGTTISDRNQGLRIKQFYSVAIHPTNTNYFLAGAQDNGTHQLNGAGLTTSVEVTGGDGAFVHIDKNQPQYQWGAYVYNQYRRSADGGATWTSVNISSSAGRFINPTDYNDVNNIMYCSGAAGAFYRWSTAQTGSTATSVGASLLGTRTVSAIKVSSYTNNLVFLAGGVNGSTPILLKAASANATPVYTNITPAAMTTASTNISCIELGTDDQNMLVTLSNYGVDKIWVSANGGASWAVIDGNLPNMPVRWAMFYPGDNTKAIIATETGVWQTSLINGAATIWEPETSFPNVRTDMLQYRAADGLLAASTHGRGIFTTTLSGNVSACGTVTGLTSTSITTSGATINWTALSDALNYDVDYKVSTSSTWTSAAVATTNLSATITGLAQATLYDYRVRANCSSASGVYATAQFTTSSAATCGTVIGLGATGISQNAATLSWSALSGANNYDVDYKLNTATVWTNAATASTALSVSITGLTAGSLYNYRVRANCTGATGSYSSAQFTTITATASCPSVYDVSTNNTVSGAATIALNTDVLGQINVGSDIDFYRFNITTTGTATITLGTMAANFDLYLYSSNGTTLLSSSKTNGTTAETISGTFSAGTYYLKVIPRNTSTSSSLCYTLKVQTGTATVQYPLAFANTEVKVFPNPARGTVSIYLVGDNTVKNLVLYDATGKVVYNQKLNDMITTLNIDKLAKGLYMIRVMSDKGVVLHNQKLVKN